MKQEVGRDTNCNWCTRNNSPRISKVTLRGQVETIQTIAFLRSAKILRRVLETCCHSDSSEKPSANAGMKNAQVIIIIITNESPDPGQKTRLNNNQQKKSTFKIVDFAVPADHRVKLKNHRLTLM